ncbi:hypothetical protein ILP92_03880 [Maribius pontilimi]|uniref:Uncharacterized protein n=1 Tax=Palleronia pontilimi TaxID=1964209 RepID=A0A934IA59_9RHOB|nr:hypothetical protein [Palleronia pontilimi]MBJ3761886.1 hypothetical protein [Palleronia pontilimi]
MKIALTLTAISFVALSGVETLYGQDATYQVASGGIIAMSAIIAGTFLWLWRVRATPLALGMSFSWSGSALVLAWWWALAARGVSTSMSDHPALMGFVAIYTTGAVLHFTVIEGSLGWPRHSGAVIPLLAFAASGLATWLI